MSLTTVQGQMLTAPLTLTGNLTFSDGSTQTAAASPFSLKNRIINGDMVIDQRNNGVAVTNINGAGFFITDRWKSMAVNSWAGSGVVFAGQQNRNSLTPPSGFVNYLGISTTTASASLPATATLDLTQVIEGFNVADLGWGTANARTVTLSFWVRSNLTGTFGGSLINSAYNRSYIFSYTISSANTWEQKTITVAGDTSGTWLTTNGIGISVSFSLGAGSSMMTTAGVWNAGLFGGVTGQQQISSSTSNVFYITGVQLERNTTATPFEWLPYGMELALCQRYFQRLGSGTVADIAIGSGISRSSTIAAVYVKHNTPMRTAPTVTQSSLVVTDAETYNATVTSISINASTSESRVVATCSGGGMTQFRPALLSQITSGTGYLDLSAEL